LYSTIAQEGLCPEGRRIEAVTFERAITGVRPEKEHAHVKIGHLGKKEEKAAIAKLSGGNNITGCHSAEGGNAYKSHHHGGPESSK